jgi:outer membrane protein assembly factor BamB
MKRGPLVLLVVLVLVGAGAVFVVGSGACRTPKGRIAQKTVYQGSATLPADAKEWPRWLGPFGDGISRETNLAEEWPEDGPAELWAAEVGVGYASPVAAGGRLYLFTMAGSTETLTCFDANSGRILWNQEGGSGRTRSYPGTRATPAIDGNDIVTLGGAGELTCRDLATGNARWTLDILDATNTTPQDWGTASSPLIDGNRVFVQGGQGGSVALAVDRVSGEIAWQSEATGIGGYAHPILADVDGQRQLIVFGGKAVYGMNPADGKTLWSHPRETQYDVHASTPVYRDGHLFLTSHYGTGSVMLKVGAGGASPLWERKEIQSRFQPAILDGDALYLNSDGKLTCLKWPTGETLWADKSDALKLGDGGSFVRLQDQRVIALGQRGRLTLARATPEKLEPVSGFDALDGAQIWATPLVYGGRLYVKGEQELVCYDISAGGVATTRTTTTTTTTTSPAAE